MQLSTRFVTLSMVVLGLFLVAGCGERPQIAFYMVQPLVGQEKVTEADEDRLRAVLDKVAAAYQMPKTKPSDEDIIRYYQPTSSLTVAFYAKRANGNIAVHLLPLSRGFERREYYQQFHASLVAALSQNFPGRVLTSKEP